jgi:hypothetical protein
VRHDEVLDGDGEGESKARLREAYVDLYLGKLDLRIGKQLLIWGRADAINPTDNLVPREFTLLVPVDEDQRLGAPAVRASWFLTEHLSLVAVGIADYEADTVPLPALPPPLRFARRAPDGSEREWALKLEEVGRSKVDWSVSFFHGLDRLPDAALDSTGPLPVVLIRSHELEVLGADFATNAGRFGLRGEGAWARAADEGGDDPFLKNDFLFLVLGADRTLPRDVYVNVQALYRHVYDFADPARVPDPLVRAVALEQGAVANQLDANQHGVSLKVSRSFRNETVEAELTGVRLFPRDDSYLRPKLTWDVTDELELTVGGEVFSGGEASFFGRLRKNRAAFVELARSF